MKWAKIKIGNAHNMSDTVPGSILLITSKYGQKIKDRKYEVIPPSKSLFEWKMLKSLMCIRKKTDIAV